MTAEELLAIEREETVERARRQAEEDEEEDPEWANDNLEEVKREVPGYIPGK